MSLANILDIILLGDPLGKSAFAAGRLGDELAFARLPDDNTIADLLSMREKIEASFYGHALVSARELEKYGEQLGQVLLADSIGELYASARAKGVRINLAINDCELQRLPWEFLHARGEIPGPQMNLAIVRIVSSGRDAGVAEANRPAKLTVLLLVSRGPSDTAVPLDDLTKSMETRFAAFLEKVKVELEVRPVDTSAGFQRAVQEKADGWDVVHFLGHGEVRNIGGEQLGGLLLTGSNDKTQFVDARRLGAIFDPSPPRLLILSACATGQTAVKAQFSNLARVLLKRNVPAVVANQMVITAESVAGFCAGLYGKLLGTGDIDEAVCAGRLQSYATLVSDTDDTARVEWGVPVLYRHFGAQRLFR